MNIILKADITSDQLDYCWIGQLGFIKKSLFNKIIFRRYLVVNNIEYVQSNKFKVLSEDYLFEADVEFRLHTGNDMH